MKKLALILISTLIVFTACQQEVTPEAPDLPELPDLSQYSPACNYDKLPIEQAQDLIQYSQHANMKTSPEPGDTIATLETNHGNIKMLLYTEEVPETTKNFTELAKAGKYDGTIFHRVIDCFMIQGGDFENRDGTGGYSYKGPGTSLKDEFAVNLEHHRGAVSMANSGPNTGGSQFFIVQAELGTPWLDGKHAIFGYVYQGMDVVDEIAAVEADSQMNKPAVEVEIEKVEISTFEE